MGVVASYLAKLTHIVQRFLSQTLHWPARALILSLSFLVFALLDCTDRVLCVAFRVLDSVLDSGASPCYCRRRVNGTLPHAHYVDYHGYGDGKCPSHANLSKGCSDFVSGEMQARPSDVKHASNGYETSSVSYVRHANESRGSPIVYSGAISGDRPSQVKHDHDQSSEHSSMLCTSSVVRTAQQCSQDMIPNSSSGHWQQSIPFLKRKIVAKQSMSRWSDCGCSTCTMWQLDKDEHLHVQVGGQDQNVTSYNSIAGSRHENVIFLHGFLSSSRIWSEKIIPHLAEETRRSYRLYAVDLLGFGKSPKPRNCFYTMSDQIKKIEESVLQRYNIDSFHIVAHSMGCIVALALAATHVDAVKTVTLVAPPYFQSPENELASSYVMRQLAPRKVWPLTAFGASVMSWYEHVGRVVCFVICKQHRVWERVLKAITLNRVSSSAILDFMQHTHHSAWHIFHNVVCAEAHAMDSFLSILDRGSCEIHVLHGTKDEVVPPYCSLQLQKRCPKVKLQVLDGANHFNIILNPERKFALMLGHIWMSNGTTMTGPVERLSQHR